MALPAVEHPLCAPAPRLHAGRKLAHVWKRGSKVSWHSALFLPCSAPVPSLFRLRQRDAGLNAAAESANAMGASTVGLLLSLWQTNADTALTVGSGSIILGCVMAEERLR
jgi:hypothetical protein